MDALRDAFHFITDVEGMIRWGGYFALAAIVFVETGLMVGFFLPGDSLLVTAGLFAARGTLNIVVLNVLLITMAILGDATGYYIGKKLGPALFRRKNSRLFKRDHLVKTQLFYEKHGGKTIIIARFVPIIRTFAPVVAGIAGMKYRRFAAFNIVGGIGWVISMTMIGYLLGRTIPEIDKYIEWVIVAVVFLSILPGIIEGWRQRKEKQRAASEYKQVVAEMVARAHDPEGQLQPMEEATAEVLDTGRLSDAAYQHLEWDYQAKFEQAVKVISESLGEPDRADGVATWSVQGGAVSLQYEHQGRATPMRISLVTTPSPRGG
jgi:membrane-associated protein